VSKNVCHRTLYDLLPDGWHARGAKALKAPKAPGTQGARRLKALEIMHGEMSNYLANGKSGKMIHDPLALAVALDESVCTLAEVKLSPEGDNWGCKPSHGSGIWISIDYDEDKFKSTLLQDERAE